MGGGASGRERRLGLLSIARHGFPDPFPRAPRPRSRRSDVPRPARARTRVPPRAPSSRRHEVRTRRGEAVVLGRELRRRLASLRRLRAVSRVAPLRTGRVRRCRRPRVPRLGGSPRGEWRAPQPSAGTRTRKELPVSALLVGARGLDPPRGPRPRGGVRATRASSAAARSARLDRLARPLVPAVRAGADRGRARDRLGARAETGGEPPPRGPPPRRPAGRLRQTPRAAPPPN